ncbi:MAG: hypothetical protein Q4A47_05990 [Erysipelotrichaceae bacterium]|nr:hypothetical protein [Erysipelotrichaceae bacterium]
MNNKTIKTIEKIPTTIEEFQSLPQFDRKSPYDTAILVIVALLNYKDNPELAFDMINVLKGPNPLSPYEKQFLHDRLRDKTHVVSSFIKETSPNNDYQYPLPFHIEAFDNPYSFVNEGYAKIFLTSSGADSPRPIVLRLGKDQNWYLYEILCLSNVRPPESTNFWA